MDSEPYCEPTCPCGTQFCFACTGPPHSPCTCEMCAPGIECRVYYMALYSPLYPLRVECYAQSCIRLH